VIDVTLQAYTKVDGVVLNHGVLDPLGPVAESKLEEWRAHFEVNFFSLVTILKLALPSLRESKGRVVLISSGAAVGGTGAWGPYNASKAALNSLTRTIAQEEPDVTFVALRPGMVATTMQEELRAKGKGLMSEKDYARFTTAHEEGKLLKPEQPAEVIVTLALKAGKALSGQYVSWDAAELASYRE